MRASHPSLHHAAAMAASLCEKCHERPVYFQGECEQDHTHKLSLCWKCACKRQTYQSDNAWIMGHLNATTCLWEPKALCTNCEQLRFIHLHPIMNNEMIQKEFYQTFTENCLPSAVAEHLLEDDPVSTALKSAIQSMQKTIHHEVIVCSVPAAC